MYWIAYHIGVGMMLSKELRYLTLSRTTSTRIPRRVQSNLKTIVSPATRILYNIKIPRTNLTST